MSMALQMRIKELEERVENLVQHLNKVEQFEKRLTEMEQKYHMLNARMGKRD